MINKNNNHLKIGVLLSYITLGLGYLIYIIYTPIMLRLLGQNEFGLYSLAGSLIGYLGLLNLGLGSAYIRYYLKYKTNDEQENIAKLNGMFLIIFIILGLISMGLGMYFVFNISKFFGTSLTFIEQKIAKKLLFIMVLNSSLLFPSIVFNSYIMANERFIFQKIIQLLKVIIVPIISIIVLRLGYASIGLVIVIIIFNIIIELVNILYCLKNLKIKFNFKKFDFLLMKEMTIFSSFIFLNLIMDQILWNIDKVILGKFWGTSVVAIYSLAAQFNVYYITISTTISQVFVPRVNHIVFSSETKEISNILITNLMIKVGRIQFMILSLVLLIIIFFGYFFIIMWVGKEYAESYFILLLLIIPVTLPLILSLGIAVERAKNMQRFMCLIGFFMAIVNLLISIPLAKIYGGIGSALGTTLSLVFGHVIIMNWYYHYKLGLNMRKFWYEILLLLPSLLPGILFGSILFLIMDLYDLKQFMVALIIFVIIHCFSIWLLGMNKSEKDLILKPLNKIYLKIKLYM